MSSLDRQIAYKKYLNSSVVILYKLPLHAVKINLTTVILLDNEGNKVGEMKIDYFSRKTEKIKLKNKYKVFKNEIQNQIEGRPLTEQYRKLVNLTTAFDNRNI